MHLSSYLPLRHYFIQYKFVSPPQFLLSQYVSHVWMPPQREQPGFQQNQPASRSRTVLCAIQEDGEMASSAQLLLGHSTLAEYQLPWARAPWTLTKMCFPGAHVKCKNGNLRFQNLLQENWPFENEPHFVWKIVVNLFLTFVPLQMWPFNYSCLPAPKWNNNDLSL